VSIKVTCGSCGKQLRAKEESAGKKVKCPGCGDILIIPEGVYDAVEEGADAYADDYGDDPYGNDSYDDNPYADDGMGSYGSDVGSPGGGGATKPCPMCGEMIKPKAPKCRYCGEIFDAKLKKKAKSKGDDENPNVWEWLLAIFCGGIGCIVGIVYAVQGKPKGGKMIGVSLLMGFVWRIIGVVLEGLAR